MHRVLKIPFRRQQLAVFALSTSTPGNMSRYLNLIVVLCVLTCTLLSCKCGDAQPESTHPEYRSMDAQTTPEHDAAPPDASISHPIFNNCVLHAGNVKVQRRQALFADGGVGPEIVNSSCDINAECSRIKGTPSAGDGSVSMDCIGELCTCTYLSSSKGSHPVSQKFKPDKPCDSAAQAELLLTKNCLSGMFKASDPSARR